MSSGKTVGAAKENLMSIGSHSGLEVEMVADFESLELDRYKITFDKNTVPGLKLYRRLPNLIHLRERPNSGNIAVIGIYNQDISEVNISSITSDIYDVSSITSDIYDEFGIPGTIKFAKENYEKLGDNLWYVYNIDANNSAGIEVWLLELGDKFTCEIMAGFLKEENPRRSQIRNLIESIRVAQR